MDAFQLARSSYITGFLVIHNGHAKNEIAAWNLPIPSTRVWGKIIMPYADTIARRRHFPSTTSI